MVIEQGPAADDSGVSLGVEPRHAAVPVRELVFRALLVLVAAVAAFVGASVLLTAPLTLLAILAVVERVVRFRRRGLLDAVLCAVAGTIAGFALLGLLLNFLPWGLTRQSWAVGAGALALIALAGCLRRDDPPSVVNLLAGHHRAADRAQWAPYTLVFIAAGLLLVAGSLVLAGLSSAGTHLTPVEMSASETTAAATEISLQSDAAAGPFDIVVQSDAGTVVAATGLLITPGSPTVIAINSLPAGYVVVQLTPTGGTDAIRELIFDNSIPVGEN
ncbi:MAG: hypothetical protein ABWZ02_12305 [Nakamurella sp.]